MTPTCPKCNAKVTEAMGFCPNCGTNLKSPPLPASPLVSTNSEYPVQSPPDSSKSNDEDNWDRVSAMTRMTINLYVLSIVLTVVTIPLAYVMGAIEVAMLGVLGGVFASMLVIYGIPQAKSHNKASFDHYYDTSHYTDGEYHSGRIIHITGKRDAGDSGILAGGSTLLITALMAGSALLWGTGIPAASVVSGLPLVIGGISALTGGINYKMCQRRYMPWEV